MIYGDIIYTYKVYLIYSQWFGNRINSSAFSDDGFLEIVPPLTTRTSHVYLSTQMYYTTPFDLYYKRISLVDNTKLHFAVFRNGTLISTASDGDSSIWNALTITAA